MQNRQYVPLRLSTVNQNPRMWNMLKAHLERMYSHQMCLIVAFLCSCFWLLGVDKMPLAHLNILNPGVILHNGAGQLIDYIQYSTIKYVYFCKYSI